MKRWAKGRSRSKKPRTQAKTCSRVCSSRVWNALMPPVIRKRSTEGDCGKPAVVAQAHTFFLGFFWIGWDRDKQGWHDKIAGTVVVRVPKSTSLVCY
jgi:hypothetical protein